MIKSIILTLVFILQSFILSQSGNERFNTFLKDWAINKDIPSISAGIYANGKIHWSGSYGFSNIENDILATPKTPYRIASISKTITAVAIMQLVERGKVKLDVDIRKYIPQFPAKRWAITIRHILNHTAGVRNYKNQSEFDNKTNFSNTNELLLYIAADSLEFEPSTKYLYSTLAYNLLTAIIENVTGLYFDEYLRKYIFEPAGMKDSYLDFYNRIIPRRAGMYSRNKKRELENSPFSDQTFKLAGGGILSSAEDLVKFGAAMLNNTLVKKSSIDSMLVKVKLPGGTEQNYGMGISLREDSKKRFYYGHAGAWNSSDLLIFPNEKVVITHVINLRDRNTENPSVQLAALYFKDSVEYPKKSVSDLLFNLTLKAGIDSALNLYNSIKTDSAEIYSFTQKELMYFANDLLENNFVGDAIIAFTKITEEFPNYADAYLSLGNAYIKDNNEGMALRSFRKALSIEPKNKKASAAIKKITRN